MKRKHHEIELEPLQEWINSNEIVYASSSRENKRLVFTMNGYFKLIVTGKVVWQGTQPYSAVERYNEITDKFQHVPNDFQL